MRVGRFTVTPARISSPDIRVNPANNYMYNIHISPTDSLSLFFNIKQILQFEKIFKLQLLAVCLFVRPSFLS